MLILLGVLLPILQMETGVQEPHWCTDSLCDPGEALSLISQQLCEWQVLGINWALAVL